LPCYTGKCRECGHEMLLVISEYLSTGDQIDIPEPCPACDCLEWFRPRPELVAAEQDNWKFQAHGNDLDDPRLAEAFSEAPIQRHERKRLYFGC